MSDADEGHDTDATAGALCGDSGDLPFRFGVIGVAPVTRSARHSVKRSCLPSLARVGCPTTRIVRLMSRPQPVEAGVEFIVRLHMRLRTPPRYSAARPSAGGDNHRPGDTHSMFLISVRDCRISARSCRRSSMASRVYRPCFSAFLLPRGAPDPGAPPCIRQRFFPITAGDRQALPDRVLAPQRRLDSIGPVLRG